MTTVLEAENKLWTELRTNEKGYLKLSDTLKVDREGIEPPTHGFSVHCSTN